ncbi:peroxisomal leader peptide-processing protease [Culicoides brevitarsis]|uniref:peroxisomal leader peptide-processing protease n=1 Tax=Culicoides brevitarsis TaxID=469753 RepID=UPI00307B51A9
MYDITHCTINYDGETRGHSGILFDEHHVITSASFLLTAAIKSGDKRHIPEVIKRLSAQELLDFENVKGAFRSFRGMKVTFRDDKSGEMKILPAQIRFLFNSRNALNVLRKILSNFSTNLEDSSQSPVVFSTFLLITIKPCDESLESKIEMQGNIMRHSGQQWKFEKSDLIFTRTTSFGHHSFFDTRNHGIISNILGESGAVMLLSMPLCPGSEGGGVFTPKSKLIGIILMAEMLHNSSSKDNVQLTIALRHDELLNELAQQSTFAPNELPYVPLKQSLVKSASPGPFERNTVMIDAGTNWGCGAFVTFQGKKFIFTCSHVIQGTSRIEVVWAGGRFTPSVIYKTCEIYRPYDIAILGIPSHIDIPREYFSLLAKYRPAVGSKVFCVGFPLFSSLASQNSFSPSIFNGFITKYSEGILWTDAQVQAGQSGGPIFDAVGHLVGICVSNTRDENSGKVFPHVNMAVPICDIFKIIEKYVETGDKETLKALRANDEVTRKWNLEPQPFTSKL